MSTPGAAKPAAGRQGAGRQGAGRQGEGRRVTLITGDRLTVRDGRQAVAEPSPARRGIRFAEFSSRGQHYVIPSDALPALAAGKLDQQLFNVTKLVESGFTDGTLPLIVTYAGSGKPAARSLLSAGRATVTHDLTSVNGLGVSADEASLGRLWTQLTTTATQGRRLKSSIAKVWLDQVWHTNLDRSVPQVGAPTAWAAGYDGTGTTVAVLDSGIDTNHPDLAGKVIAAQNFTTDPDTRDASGHGTHVASIIAGSGAASQGRYRGVAPGTRLLNGKVCVAGGCSLTSIIDGMEWAAAQGADVVNMSLGGPDDTPEGDQIEQSLNNLTASTGTLFVVAAGNIPQTATLASPGTAEGALTVGAVDGSDKLASFSHRGPVPSDASLKPDMTAPGVDIMAAQAGTQGYIEHSGTSMAAPHVAGAAAIVLQRRPSWTAPQLKSALVGSAVPNASLSSYEQGSGRLDVVRAYQQTVLAEPASLSLGRQKWPHNDDLVLTRTVTYRNHGTSAVTLHLALSTRGPSGAAAPAGMFALNATSVTVPAGGTASATLTTDTRVNTPDGYYTGAITATAAGIGVRTAFAVDRAIESYDLTVEHLSRQGGTTGAYFCLVQRADGEVYWLPSGPGPVTVPRLPKGTTYMVVSMVYDGGPQGLETSMLSVPRVEMTQDRSLVMDARLAQPVSITVPDSRVAPQSAEFSVQMTGSGESAWFNGRVTSGAAYSAQIGNQYAWGTIAKIGAVMAEPGSGNGFFDSPRVYNLAWYTDQRMPTGWTRDVAASDLATVRAAHAGHIPGSVAIKAAFAHPSNILFGTYVSSPLGQGLGFDLPFERTEFYNTDGGVRWHSVLIELASSTGRATNHLVSPVTRYTGNTTTQQSWNRPVYGPSFASSIYPQHWVVRRGNKIIVDLPLTGDGDGHPGLPHPDTVSGTLVLKRNGTVVGESAFPVYGATPQFGVPTGNARYRLEAAVDRAAPMTLSTHVGAAWTFDSDAVDPNAYLRLPLWAVTFSPATDPQGTAPSGRAFQIPLRAHVQPDSASSGLRTLTVEYSLDDGGTWQNATVTRAADGTGTATVTHPDGTGFVSLRARAEDWAGNTVEQTVIRAYRIAPA